MPAQRAPYRSWPQWVRPCSACVGQHIDWPAPGGKTLKLTLLAVEYQPEAAGEYE
ncbi:hypothetical protein GCM10009085_28870 [Pseudomonas avellanae]|nr:hypothetical protein GCM10009085_28870 [Pseudomonas avellanae]